MLKAICATLWRYCVPAYFFGSPVGFLAMGVVFNLFGNPLGSVACGVVVAMAVGYSILLAVQGPPYWRE